MGKGWKLIVSFAPLGPMITAFVAYMASSDILDFAIFCPPILLSIPFSEIMRDKGGAYVIWPLIGLLNSGLYAVIGAAVVGLRKK